MHRSLPDANRELHAICLYRMIRDVLSPSWQVNLTMALVPLEERLQSKENAWESERRDLVIRAEESVRNVKAAEERARDLEKRRSEMEQER